MNANRRFLHEAIKRGLELEVITPADMLAHVTPDVLAHHLPIALKARLLQTSLNADRMTPQLVVDTVGIAAMVEHAPMATLWACVRACTARQLQEPAGVSVGSTSPAPATGNGGGANAGEDLQLKPSTAARSTSLRAGSTPPPRISALSPRSQLLRRASEPGSAQVASGMFEIAPSDSVPDFEIVEATEVPSQHRSVDRGDDDSGSKS